MKANQASLNEFLAQQKAQFIIPVYQRNYDWKIQQCRQLLDDIITVGKDPKQTAHFIGSIVYIHDGTYSSSSITELTIIDGQQRIITVTLIYFVIYTIAKEINDVALRQEIYEKYLISKSNQEEELRLKLTEPNDKALKYLLIENQNEPYPEFSRLVENFKYFKDLIAENDLNIIQAGLDKLIFVEISLERQKGDNPQKIFESLNSTGLDLTQADLIRNYILMGLNREQQSKYYREFWQPIERNTTDEKKNSSKISDFIRDFLTIENCEISNKNSIYEEFKKKYLATEIQDIEQILLNLKRLSSHYNKIINPNKEPDKAIREQLNLINRLEINVSHPFLLKTYDDYVSNIIDKKTFIEILEIIQSFVWRRFIVELPTNALSKIFMRLHEDIDKSQYTESLQFSLLKRKGKQRFPNDQEVINCLKGKDMYNIQSKNRMYFLERLENYQNQEKVEIENNSLITIEHIFPQNPGQKWKIELGEENYEKMQNYYLNTIANLTLSGNNGSLSNKSFIEKRDMNIDGKEQGYRYSRLWLNKHLSTLDKWDCNEAENRFAQIAERFFKIWKYPTLRETINYNYEEINIFDADNPTGKRLEYIIFLGQKFPITTITELYIHVIKTLFELQPETFLNVDINKKISLTNNKELLRTASKISNSYYVESNYNSMDKFERIKQILSAFEIEDDLLIKYAKE